MRDDVGCGSGKDDAIRARDFDRAVVFVEHQLLGAVEDGVGAEGRFQGMQ